MTAKTNVFEIDLLELMTQNVALANIGNSAGLLPSSVAGNYFIALFTADPGEAGAFTNEATYTGYARKSIARSASEWSVALGIADNDNAITFAQCTGGSNAITHAAICKTLAGTASDDMVIKGILTTQPITISTSITPEFAAGAFDWSED